MTQITQEQQDASQATAEQVVAKFRAFVAALPGDEQQVLALALASAPYVAAGAVRDAGIQDDTRGFADNTPIPPINPIVVFGVTALLGGVLYDAAKEVAKDLTTSVLPPQLQ